MPGSILTKTFPSEHHVKHVCMLLIWRAIKALCSVPSGYRKRKYHIHIFTLWKPSGFHNSLRKLSEWSALCSRLCRQVIQTVHIRLIQQGQQNYWARLLTFSSIFSFSVKGMPWISMLWYLLYCCNSFSSLVRLVTSFLSWCVSKTNSC